MIHYFFFLSLIALIIATYTDLKERIISNKLTYAMVFGGLLLQLTYSMQLGGTGQFITALGVTIATFIGSYAFWKIGLWAGGDVKMMTGLAAMNPVNYGWIRDFFGLQGIELFKSIALPVFPLTLFIGSLFAMLPYGAAITIYGLLKNKKLQKKVLLAWKKTAISLIQFLFILVGLERIFALNQLETLFVIPLALVFVFLPKNTKTITAIVLMAAALWLDFTATINEFVLVFVALFAAYALIKLFLIGRKEILIKEEKISELEEGMIAGETIVEEKGKPKRLEEMTIKNIIKHFKNNNLAGLLEMLLPKGKALANSKSAAGLTAEQVKKLKELVKKKKLENKIKVKLSAPFVPAVLIAFVLLQLLGDILWNVVF